MTKTLDRIPRAGGSPGIMVSSHHPRYFAAANGKTFVPIGLNLCFPRFATTREDGLEKMFHWLDRLSENGGNYARIFLGHAFFDLECGSFGTFDEEKASRLDAVLDHAGRQGILLKLTIDLFRTIEPTRQAESFPGAVGFAKPNFHVGNGGPFRDIGDYLTSVDGRAHFLRKLDWLAARYGRHPGIFGWDLWNEMNAVRENCWRQWTREMLPELKMRFPRHLAAQTLGSMDCGDSLEVYEEIMSLPENEFSQVHRYLDLGASLAICHGPVDVMMADAVENLLRIARGKPAVLAEGGAVEPKHMRPWLLYPADKEGTVLHDILFAPFFSGAAGCGQAWHWQEYIELNNLWWHFARFSNAIEGVDPVAERMTPRRWDTARLRVYALQGDNASIAWCRDKQSDWRSEVAGGEQAAVVENAEIRHGLELDAGSRVTFYDPWTDQSGQETPASQDVLFLPPFRRSLVARFQNAVSNGMGRSNE